MHTDTEGKLSTFFLLIMLKVAAIHFVCSTYEVNYSDKKPDFY